MDKEFEIENMIEALSNEKGYRYGLNSILCIIKNQNCYDYVLKVDEYSDEIIIWSDKPQINKEVTIDYQNFLNEIEEKCKLIETEKVIRIVFER